MLCFRDKGIGKGCAEKITVGFFNRYQSASGMGKDKPDDPWDKTVALQAGPIEDVESVSIFEQHPNWQTHIGTTLEQSLRAEFITFLKANSEVIVWSYNNMPAVSSDIISHRLSICPTFKPIHQKRRAYDVGRYEAMQVEVDKLPVIGFILEVSYPT